MLFFGNKNSGRPRAKSDSAGKPSITVGRLFNPEIGATLRPFADTGKLLIDLIATIFGAYGLIPRNHPALLGGAGAHFTLGDVMGTAWRNLSFTREKLPQALIFFAVILSLVCSALAVVVGLLAAFSGTAHAQTPTSSSMFQPVDTGGDIACGWINWLFNTTTNGCVLQDYLSAATNGQQTLGNLQSSTVQAALITALGFYSDAILVVAAVVLFYHLVSMVVETAHHGVPMGKRASQVWAPIRLVVAVGLLVPVSGGLNSGQYIVIQLAQWGSGLASQTWSTFVSALVTDSGNLGQANAPYVRQVTTDTVMMEACAYAYNQISQSEANGNTGIAATQISTPPTCQTRSSDSSQKCSYTPNGSGGNSTQSDTQLSDIDLCGVYILPGTVTTSSSAAAIETQAATSAQTTANSAFTSMQKAARTYAIAGMQNFVPQVDGGTQGGSMSQNTDFESIVNNYQQQLQSAASSAAGSLSGSLQQVATTSSSEGWVSAGAWFNTISRVVGSIATMVHDLLPKTTPPKVGLEVGQNKLGTITTEYAVREAMKKFQQWFGNETNASGGAAGSSTDGNQQLQLAAADMAQSGGTETHVMDYIFWIVDWIASFDGVWTPPGSFDQATQTTPQNFTLGVQFLSANPLAEIANLGHHNIDAAYDIFDAYLLLQSIAGGLQEAGALAQSLNKLPIFGMITNLLGVVGQISSSAVGAVGDVLGTITVVFFTAGFMLAYFFPLIPFMRFLFGTIGWFLSLLESIVAVPLIALAHLTPEGEGLPGEKAKAAYYMLFNLFLKPVMMVFGLIVGLLIFNLAASALNLLYMTAVIGTGGISHGHITLARLVYSILYVVMLYLCCNNCFKMIDWLPEHCIKWMGAQGLHHPQMTDPTEIGSYMTAAAGYVDQKIVGGAGQLMKGGGPLAMGALMNAAPGLQKGMGQSSQRLGNIGGAGKGPSAQEGTQKYIDLSKAGENAVVTGGADTVKTVKGIFEALTGNTGSGSTTPPPASPPPQKPKP